MIIPHLLHVLLLDHLPLSARTLPQVDFITAGEDTIREYIDHFSIRCKEIVRATDHEPDGTLVDLVDGRLLRLTLHIYNALPKALPAALISVAKQIAWDLGTKDSVAYTRGQICDTPHSQIPSSEVMSFSHAAFDKHLEVIHICVNDDKPQASGRLALDLTHWHNSKLLVITKGPKPKRTLWEEKRIQQKHQRHMANLTAYACSLIGTVTQSLDPKLIQVDDAIAIKAQKKAPKPALQERPKNVAQKQPAQSNKRLEVKALQQKAKLKKQGVKQESDTRPAQEAVLTEKRLIDILQHEGPQLDRSMDAREDPRVPFLPDAWQVKVLDEIDQGNSLLVTAPTSAGKTFISFYAMEKALRASDDAVLVYVAPTKSLVNQIAAEVLAKFKKQYPYPGAPSTPSIPGTTEFMSQPKPRYSSRSPTCCRFCSCLLLRRIGFRVSRISSSTKCTRSPKQRAALSGSNS
jgi:hypothetical protein